MAEELFGSDKAALYFAKGFMEKFHTVKDVTIFVADRL